MKKLVMCFLVSMCILGIAACGNETSEKDVTAQFKNSVFLGDSITEGFTKNEILPKECVIAGAGATAGFTYDEIGGLAAKKPDHVFIMLGSDDMLWPKGDPKVLFEHDMTKLINKIKEEVPNTKIYLESITPVTQEALKEEPRYKNIDDYNKLLQELADKLSVNYVDIGAVAKKHPDLFAEDGIHFKKEFYPLWLEELSKSL
ncbi:lipase [Ktedonosporobacter rubrisoli]|uniref:Lipase n=1 Tax=Ktedonosporobacter rubrisoli TaxID=2509675 RepID=A0A4V0YYU4_KTERU|nr:GDSL-type esterase/lipase family protein [Ktedonosporobacter rubrisoli]QBD77431.1 lipase [Ktedonosporobacter rubrisoli]